MMIENNGDRKKISVAECLNKSRSYLKYVINTL